MFPSLSPSFEAMKTQDDPFWRPGPNGRQTLICKMRDPQDQSHIFSITDHLGIVEPRKDGRWNWWLKPRHWGTIETWTVSKPSQGVANTLDAAKAAVEDGFTTRAMETSHGQEA